MPLLETYTFAVVWQWSFLLPAAAICLTHVSTSLETIAKTAKPSLDPRRLAFTQPNSANHLHAFMRALFEPDGGNLFDDRCLADEVQTLCRDSPNRASLWWGPGFELERASLSPPGFRTCPCSSFLGVAEISWSQTYSNLTDLEKRKSICELWNSSHLQTQRSVQLEISNL